MHQLTRLSISFPKTVLVALILATVGLAFGMPGSRVEFGYRPLLGGDHPAIERLEGFVERFGGGFPILIAWECGSGAPCETAFDSSSLGMAHAVVQDLMAVEGVQGIESPATSPLLVPDPEGFAVRRFVEGGVRVADASELADRALIDPLWSGTLVSRDGRSGSIVLQLVDTSSETSIRVIEAVQAALREFEERGFEFHLVGHAVEFVIAGRELAESSAGLVPVTAIVIALMIFLLSRSLWMVLLTLLSMGVALVWTFGLLGWLGWPQDSILQALAPLILIMGVCDAIHFLSRYAHAQEDAIERESRREALIRTARDTGAPCLVTTLTTAAALASFATSDLATFLRFGVISAFGVSVCLLLTFSLLPILAQAVPVRTRQATPLSRTWIAALEAVSRSARLRAVPILVATAVLFLVCGIGWLSYLRVDTDGYEMYGDDSQVIGWIRFVESHFDRADNLEIEVLLPEGVDAADPEALASVARFSEFLSADQSLGSTTSILDLLGWMNRLLHADDPAHQQHANTIGANSELIELIGLGNRALLERWLSPDRTRLRLSVDAPFASYTEREHVLGRIEAWAEGDLPSDWDVQHTGPFSIGFDWVRDVQGTQLRSFVTAFSLVFLLVALFLRSAAWSLVAMVPTLLPVVVTLGGMGILGLSLDVGRAMIAAVIIGIAVDDAVHLLTQYRRRRKRGVAVNDAIQGALLHVGPALVTTSFALSLGFLSLLASPWQTISSFGFFVSLSILGALAAALFVLPALIVVFERMAPGGRVRVGELDAR